MQNWPKKYPAQSGRQSQWPIWPHNVAPPERRRFRNVQRLSSSRPLAPVPPTPAPKPVSPSFAPAPRFWGHCGASHLGRHWVAPRVAARSSSHFWRPLFGATFVDPWGATGWRRQCSTPFGSAALLVLLLRSLFGGRLPRTMTRQWCRQAKAVPQWFVFSFNTGGGGAR